MDDDDEHARDTDTMSHLVECAQTKLMRCASVSSARIDHIATQQQQQQQRQHRARAAKCALALKSPAFAKNTLDEAQLERLATTRRSEGNNNNNNIMTNRCRETGATSSLAEPHHVGHKGLSRDAAQSDVAQTEAQTTSDNSNGGDDNDEPLDDVDDDDDERRGGPTPTNDLIRALILRDKQARERRCSTATTGTTKQVNELCATAAAAKASGGGGGGGGDNNELAKIRDEKGRRGGLAGSLWADVVGSGGGDECRRRRASVACNNNNNNNKSDSSSLLARANEFLSNASSKLDCDLANATRRADLLVHNIARSHRRRSCAAAATAQSAAAAAVQQKPLIDTGRRDRKPSDPSALLARLELAERNYATEARRRRSAHMLAGTSQFKCPNNSNNNNNNSSSSYFVSVANDGCSAATRRVRDDNLSGANVRDDDDYEQPRERDDDDDDDDYDDGDSVPLSYASSTDDNEEVLSSDDDDDEYPASGRATLVVSEHQQQQHLRTSASSPSALNSDTLLTEQSMWCGGATEHRERLRLARDSELLAERLFNGAGAMRPAAAAAAKAEADARAVLCTNAHTSSLVSMSWLPTGLASLPDSSNEHTEMAASQRHSRPRVGSNPLERPAATAAITTAARPTTLQQHRPKRHSIISMFGGAVAHPVAGRLSLARLTNNNNNYCNTAANQQFQQQQRICPSYIAQTKTNADGVHTCANTMQHEQYDPLIPEQGFKIAVMGTSGVGKTSIITRFLYDAYDERHVPTVEDTYFVEFPYMRNTINISISDTSGTYQFPAMRRLAINSSDAFILVYSVESRESLEQVEQLRQNILDEREQAYLEAVGSLDSCATTNTTCSTSSGGQQQQRHSIASTSNTSGLGDSIPTVAAAAAAAATPHERLLSVGQATQSRATSPLRHWSLGALFHGLHLQQQQQQSVAHQLHAQQQQSMSSASSSGNSDAFSGSMSSACSSADTSRRSSVSAAEASLRTRRKRKPPIVIVANKHDLPDDKHAVNSDEVEAIAVIDWGNGFVRASAALNLNVDEIFQQVLRQARQPPTLTDAIVSKRRKSLPPAPHHQTTTTVSQQQQQTIAKPPTMSSASITSSLWRRPSHA